jgi:hypothetical protein
MYGDALCSGRLALETHPDFLSDPSRGNVRGLKTSHQPIKAKALKPFIADTRRALVASAPP